MTRSRRRPLRVTAALSALAAAAAVALLAACSGGSDLVSGAEAPIGTEDDVEPTGDLTVFAAAALQGVFTELATTFEERYPGVTVSLSFAASSALVAQLDAGAPVDVLATASAETMQQARPHTATPIWFAQNSLVIVTPSDNPGAVTGLADFADPDRTLAVCAVEVPCGAAAEKVFAVAGITPAVDTYAENVTAALNLATSGEVDAALVYATDAQAAGETVTTVTFPEAAEAITDLLIAVTNEAPNPDAAQAWVDLVRSEGESVLRDAGFGPPP